MSFLQSIFRDQYEQAGFTIIPNFMTSDELFELQHTISQVDKNPSVGKFIYEEDGQTMRSLMSYHNNDLVLKKYTRHPKILNIAKEIISSPIYVSQSKINKKKPQKGKKWDMHRGFTFWHLLDEMPEAHMISIFILLTDQTIENGAVYALAGSHKEVNKEQLKNESLLLGSREQDTAANLSIQIKKDYIDQYNSQYKKVYLTGKAGDLLLMHPLLLHASDANESDASRDLMITVYNAVDNLPQNRCRPDYLCEPFAKAL